jgi:hypothetical protein
LSATLIAIEDADLPSASTTATISKETRSDRYVTLFQSVVVSNGTGIVPVPVRHQSEENTDVCDHGNRAEQPAKDRSSFFCALVDSERESETATATMKHAKHLPFAFSLQRRLYSQFSP